MLQNPPPLPVVSGSLTAARPLTGTGLPDGVPINAIRVSPAMTGRGAVGRLREDACAR